jgi:hypothetical protein
MSGLPPALRLVGIGWYVALCITLGVLGGVWLDSKFDADPAFTLAGLFLGLSVAFWGGYRMLMDVISAIGPKKKG